jgi:hypothetical protein
VRRFLYSPSCGARGRMKPSPRWAFHPPRALQGSNFTQGSAYWLGNNPQSASLTAPFKRSLTDEFCSVVWSFASLWNMPVAYSTVSQKPEILASDPLLKV